MKKFIALSLLLVHLYSLYGHVVLYEYFVYQSDKIFNEKISMNQYAVDDLVAVKVPVNMPSVEDWKDYIYISGQVQFNNNSYNYVKLKMTRDTIYLMCIPNYKKTRLINQNIIDARNIADIPVNKKDHVPFGKMSSLDNFNYLLTQYRFITPVVNLKRVTHTVSSKIIKSFLATPGQPPDALETLS